MGWLGPTHHYAGLAADNQASLQNRDKVANPRQAALQGLNKMRALAARGMVQGILPPQLRPNLELLMQLGFSGSQAKIIRQAAQFPLLLSAASSAAAMWTANAATVCPSADSDDRRVHFTAANLHTHFHRQQEAAFTERMLASVFSDPGYFVHHRALPQHSDFADEGAANHNRFCQSYTKQGVQLFIYGRDAPDSGIGPQRYPARQTRQASAAIARLHQLVPELTLFARQHRQAIDQGVFHNDVISVSNQNLFLYHQHAFYQSESVLAELQRATAKLGIELLPLQVLASEVSLKQAVSSYLFNSQLLTKPDGKMLLVVPEECREDLTIWYYLQDLVRGGRSPIDEMVTFDLHQSMQNGGGPACLRLRVVLTQQELAAVNQATLFTEARYQRLVSWINQHYRDRLTRHELADPQLINEVYQALDELTQILELGSLYSFQREEA